MVEKIQAVSRRRRNRLDVNLSVAAHAALAQRISLELAATRALVTNSMLSRYADLMAQFHIELERKFNAAELDAMRWMLLRGKHLTIRELWHQDRAIAKSRFVQAVRCASEESGWPLSRPYTNKLLRMLETILSTEEYFGLIDYLAIDPAVRKAV